MGFFNKLDGRPQLMGDMANTLGIDFAEKIQKDPELVRTYRQALLQCSHCKHDGECKSWMEDHPSASETPDYCRNKELLEHLAQT